MKNYISWFAAFIFVISLVAGAPQSLRAQQKPGIFTHHEDVGTVLHKGSVKYDAANQAYTVTGSGDNMWLKTDAFQFVWKKVSGDVTLAADVAFVGTGGNPHRKAVVMLRQDLSADSPYADVARHGVGLTSLQFRDEKGDTTHEIQSNINGPERIQIAKRGDYVYMSVGDDSAVHVAGGWLKVPLHGTFYVGIGVCSHDKDVTETAVFSHVELKTAKPNPNAPTKLYSSMEIVSVDSGDRRVVYIQPRHFEAPNWTRDGKSLLFNEDGHIEKLPVSGGTPEIINTGAETFCNNDHGVSPDGTQLAISDQSRGDNTSRVFVLPMEGGTPQLITKDGPSYWHGWSPDGKTLAFVGLRNGDFDVYTIPAVGGEETRLTTAKGLDDGPDYSPDGKYIYFNSVRTGTMQIWRMNADGSDQEQITSDDYNNWFPHISPDGKWMVFLTYNKDVTGHPPNQDVMLRLMSMTDKRITVLAKLFGGQGTINVPSWSPDSKELAFVSYQLIPDEN